MILNELIERVSQKQPGCLGVAGASAEEKRSLEEWKKSGWTVTEFDGELTQAVSAAMDAAAAEKIDLLFCSGADNLRLVRMLDHDLQTRFAGKFGPLTMMQAIEVPTYSKLLWVGIPPLIRYDSVAVAIKNVERMIKTLADLGEAEAKVALLSCVELISPGIASTVWEATLAQMSARGQFGKARVDGPLAIDLAVNPHAVHEKGLKSEVAGEADLLIPPDLNSYITFVEVIHLSGEHRAAGMITGGPCPIAISPHNSLSHLDLSLKVASLLR